MYNLINNIYSNLLNKYYGIKNNFAMKNEFNEWFIKTTIELHCKETQCLLKETFNIPNKEQSKWLFE